MTSKQDLKARLEAVEAETTDDGDRLEVLARMPLWTEPEPELTDYLVSRGFVIERDKDPRFGQPENILVQATPWADALMHQLSWHRAGPTAPFDDVHIIWEDEAREAVVADATHPVEYTQVACPDEPVTIESGDGWRAVVPADRAIESMVLRRWHAEWMPYDIRRPVELPISDADEYDLVVVDADPGADRDVKPHREYENAQLNAESSASNRS